MEPATLTDTQTTVDVWIDLYQTWTRKLLSAWKLSDTADRKQTEPPAVAPRGRVLFLAGGWELLGRGQAADGNAAMHPKPFDDGWTLDNEVKTRRNRVPTMKLPRRARVRLAILKELTYFVRLIGSVLLAHVLVKLFFV